jgi:hypothetical protein
MPPGFSIILFAEELSAVRYLRLDQQAVSRAVRRGEKLAQKMKLSLIE